MADPFRIFRQKTVHLQHLGGGFAQHQMKTEIHLFHLSLFQRFCIRLIQQQGEGFQDDWGNKLEKQFAVCFLFAQRQNGLFSLYTLGRQLF